MHWLAGNQEGHRPQVAYFTPRRKGVQPQHLFLYYRGSLTPWLTAKPSVTSHQLMFRPSCQTDDVQHEGTSWRWFWEQCQSPTKSATAYQT